MPELDLRESSLRRDRITRQRLDRVIPAVMEESEIECWILVSREYAEDPVAQTMLPATWLSSRRRTILVFLREGSDVRRAAISRYEVDGLFPSAWNRSSEPDQWRALRSIVADGSPASIAVSGSESFAHADGLTATEKAQLLDALGSELAERVVPGEELAVRWLQTRIPEERPILEEACSHAHDILRRALSREAVTPSVTTTEDLEWWLRDQVQLLGCPVWFHPSASVQRSGADLRGSFANATKAVTIEPGDLVHIDFGILWDHLCTDQQQHGYVLEPGQTSVPEGLQAALSSGNRLQDILLASFEDGRTGNDVLATALDAGRRAGLDPVIYTHPIGYHGHGAGPVIGLWDQQEGVPDGGDVRIFGPSAWSIELMNRSEVPEWGEEKVSIMLEEEAWYEDGLADWVDGRQTEIWAI
ncbi:MAG: M24 family metallopeptidase [Actinobacteria bacterium]|nr:MAG: M24 family metallopeptidase [Actinomycetota bacterium]REK37777.1 MAG: M24 family metallopeptidase [Actinomycetota bacterium]